MLLLHELILSQIAIVILKESLVFRNRLNYTQTNEQEREFLKERESNLVQLKLWTSFRRISESTYDFLCGCSVCRFSCECGLIFEKALGKRNDRRDNALFQYLAFNWTLHLTETFTLHLTETFIFRIPRYSQDTVDHNSLFLQQLALLRTAVSRKTLVYLFGEIIRVHVSIDQTNLKIQGKPWKTDFAQTLQLQNSKQPLHNGLTQISIYLFRDIEITMTFSF